MGKTSKTSNTKSSSKKTSAKAKTPAKTAKPAKPARAKGAAAKAGSTKVVKAGPAPRGKVAPKKPGKGEKVAKISKKSAAKETVAEVVVQTKPAAGKSAKPAGGVKVAVEAKAPAPKGAGAKAPKAAPPPAPAPVEAAADGAADKGKKGGPKGITIVHQKPSKPSKPKVKFQLPQNEPLLKPGAKWKPLIPSGPSAPPRTDLELAGPADGTPIKTKLSKKDLEKYRQVLLSKRAELVGDVRNMESEALLQNSGSLSHTPQHMAEQGTDVSDQSLNLDLAAVDRGLIREIDAALERIDAGTYGVCEHTGKLISTERLDELPWTRYSIEAARERERRSFQP